MPNRSSVTEFGAQPSGRHNFRTPTEQATKGALNGLTGLAILALISSFSGCGTSESSGAAPQSGAEDLGPPSSRGLIKIDGKYVLSCPELEREKPPTSYYADFQAFCDRQNVEMNKDGFPACKQGYCAETWTSNRGNNRYSLELNLSQSWPSSRWQISISFRTQLGATASNRERLVCKPATEMWESGIWKARESWSFDRYLELCKG